MGTRQSSDVFGGAHQSNATVADVNAAGSAVLECSTYTAAAVEEYRLRCFAAVSASDVRALRAAVNRAKKQFDAPTARSMLCSFVDDKKNGSSLLHAACAAGDEKIVEVLLQSGLSANSVRLADGWTPLHVAASIGSCVVVRQLLTKTSDYSPCNSAGESPLQIAVREQHRDVANLLIDVGADMELALMASPREKNVYYWETSDRRRVEYFFFWWLPERFPYRTKIQFSSSPVEIVRLLLPLIVVVAIVGVALLSAASSWHIGEACVVDSLEGTCESFMFPCADKWSAYAYAGSGASPLCVLPLQCCLAVGATHNISRMLSSCNKDDAFLTTFSPSLSVISRMSPQELSSTLACCRAPTGTSPQPSALFTLGTVLFGCLVTLVLNYISSSLRVLRMTASCKAFFYACRGSLRNEPLNVQPVSSSLPQPAGTIPGHPENVMEVTFSQRYVQFKATTHKAIVLDHMKMGFIQRCFTLSTLALAKAALITAAAFATVIWQLTARSDTSDAESIWIRYNAYAAILPATAIVKSAVEVAALVWLEGSHDNPALVCLTMDVPRGALLPLLWWKVWIATGGRWNLFRKLEARNNKQGIMKDLDEEPRVKPYSALALNVYLAMCLIPLAPILATHWIPFVMVCLPWVLLVLAACTSFFVIVYVVGDSFVTLLVTRGRHSVWSCGFGAFPKQKAKANGRLGAAAGADGYSTTPRGPEAVLLTSTVPQVDEENEEQEVQEQKNNEETAFASSTGMDKLRTYRRFLFNSVFYASVVFTAQYLTSVIVNYGVLTYSPGGGNAHSFDLYFGSGGYTRLVVDELATRSQSCYLAAAFQSASKALHALLYVV